MDSMRLNGVRFPARTIFPGARIQEGLNFSTRSREVNRDARNIQRVRVDVFSGLAFIAELKLLMLCVDLVSPKNQAGPPKKSS
jgi:hypothetical protein